MMATFTRHQRRAVWATLIVAALCIVLFLLPDSVARFRWQRDLVASDASITSLVLSMLLYIAAGKLGLVKGVGVSETRHPELIDA